MARINKVGHVVLNVRDLEASMAFYTTEIQGFGIAAKPAMPELIPSTLI